MSAAAWAAVAATFSAVSSFLIYRIQLNNLRESVRPEIVLSGWDRESVRLNEERVSDRILIGAISNVGRGVALDLEVSVSTPHAGNLRAGMGEIRIPILAKDERKNIDGSISIYWHNIAPDPHTEGVKFTDLDVNIVCKDTRNIRHETQYHLHVSEINPHVVMAHLVAANVSQWWRKVKSVPEWRIKALERYRRYMDRTRAWTEPRLREGYRLVREKTLALTKRNDKSS